jgi:hypothetical protein
VTGTSVGQQGVILRTVSGGIGIQQISSEVPGKFKLLQNYPNPFNPSTTIRFLINSAGKVKLAVYDISGKEVSLIVNEVLHSGIYEAKWEAGKLTSGIYFYRLSSESLNAGSAKVYTETRKMVLLK